MVHPGRNVAFLFVSCVFEMVCGMYVFEKIFMFHIQCCSHRFGGKLLIPL